METWTSRVLEYMGHDHDHDVRASGRVGAHVFVGSCAIRYNTDRVTFSFSYCSSRQYELTSHGHGTFLCIQMKLELAGRVDDGHNSRKRGKEGRAPLRCRNWAANESLSSSGEVCVVCACHWCLHFISFFPIRTTTNKKQNARLHFCLMSPCCEPHKQTKFTKKK